MSEVLLQDNADDGDLKLTFTFRVDFYEFQPPFAFFLPFSRPLFSNLRTSSKDTALLR